jgi:hypothetical protein
MNYHDMPLSGLPAHYEPLSPLPDFVNQELELDQATYTDADTMRATAPETVNYDDVPDVVVLAGHVTVQSVIEVSNDTEEWPAVNQSEEPLQPDYQTPDVQTAQTDSELPVETYGESDDDDVPPETGDVPPVIPPETPQEVASPDPEEPPAIGVHEEGTITVKKLSTDEGDMVKGVDYLIRVQGAQALDMQQIVIDTPEASAEAKIGITRTEPYMATDLALKTYGLAVDDVRVDVPEDNPDRRIVKFTVRERTEFDPTYENRGPLGDTRKLAIEQASDNLREAALSERQWISRDPDTTAAWGPYNTGVAMEGLDGTHLEDWFHNVLPIGHSIKSYVKEIIGGKDQRYGLEVGGIGSRLFGDFETGFFTKTAGISLHDLRAVAPPGEDWYRHDALRNHTVITGDLLAAETHQKVTEWLDGHKADFIFERLYGGMTSVPKEPFAVAEQASFWYEHLSEQGVMLPQVPPTFVPYMQRWARQITFNEPRLIVRVAPVRQTFLAGWHTLSLVKLPGAPETLPLLSAREVIAYQRRYGYDLAGRQL